MKSIFSTLLLTCALFFSACNSNETNTTEGTDAAGTENLRTSSEVQGNASTASTGAVPHYICASNCAGSGGPAAGTCPVCGKEYIHNDAFHANDAQAQPEITIGDQSANPTVVPPPAEPAQNANGVWHYTCAKGCAGGAGTATTCASCGGTLAHNAAYHQ